MSWWRSGGYWTEYVPVATRVANAKKEVEKLRKKGFEIQPVELSGRKIATTFWGKGWCDHMDSFRDYENRLPRGRAYVRNGSVVHMDIAQGKISALVAGTRTYKVEILIDLLSQNIWEHIKRKCLGQISSLVDLLKGKLSDGVMKVVANRSKGLFPGPKEIKMCCTCPDYAGLCKHIAAVIYGIGARLDQRPELLFLLRGVDHAELATDGGLAEIVKKGKGTKRELAGANLSEIFGIELVESGEETMATASSTKAISRKSPRPEIIMSSTEVKKNKTSKSRGGQKAAVSASDKNKIIMTGKNTASKEKPRPPRRRKDDLKEEAAPKKLRRPAKPKISKI